MTLTPMYDSRIYWQYKFSWIPRRCDLTLKLIWLKYGYHGQKLLCGPGEPVMLEYWHDKYEHLVWTLTYD